MTKKTGCPFCDGGDGKVCDEHRDEFAFSMGRQFQRRHGNKPMTFAELLTSVVDGLKSEKPQ